MKMGSDMKDNEKRLGVLIATAIAQLQQIIRDQMELAALEIKRSVVRAVRSSVSFLAALFLLSLAVLLLIISFGFGLAALGVPTWLAFLILAGVFILIAGLLLLFAGRNASKIAGPTRAADATQATINQVAEAIARAKS